MNKLISIFIVLMTVVSLNAVAVDEYYPFENDQQRERFIRFTHELRCPKCQAQTLAGSDAGVAADLKQQIHRMILEGKSDQEIIDYMVERYGDFVLYNPPLKPKTYLLWFGPLIALLIGAVVFVRILQKQNRIED